MAAYASLVSLMHVVHDLEHHPSPPITLDKQLVDSISQRVTYFQEFLQSCNSRPPPDDDEEAANPLEMRIAASAHEAEDAIEYHIVDFIKQKRDNEPNDADDKIKSINRCVDILQTVIEEMDSIKKLVVLVDTVQTKQKPPLLNVAIRDHDVVLASNETLVGSDAILLEIMEKLVGAQLDLRVIPIVGMGGIGKTFLTKTIYAKPLVKDRFDICAWATISQSYDATEILCELLSQATKTKQQLSGSSADELGLKLYKRLFCRRFLIVMDDVWSIDSWNAIQSYFPNNDNGSRVLVTTRLSQLSLQLNNEYSLNMSFLDKDSSWDLFLKTVFGDKSSCPPELEEIGEKIVDNCRGLPLSIVVVGGLLKNMDDTCSSWESIRDNFTLVVNMNNDKHCLKLLKLSYNHLPVYLKPCFLYMGVFEEDQEIRVSTLVQLWVSEGFIRPTNGKTLETSARGFLQDLVDRNLILIGRLGPTGNLKSCKIHDLVRDMCLNECRKEGFYHVIEKCNSPLPQAMNTQRRVVISKGTSKRKARGDLGFMSSARSIICDHRDVAVCQNLVLLRTLHARKNFSFFDEVSSLKPIVFRYVNLRHLAIKASCDLPFPSFSSLWNLQTLIVSYNALYWSALLADLWEMPQFRHIEFVDPCAPLPDPPSCDDDDCDSVVVMENLHTLKGIRNFKCSEGVVKRIPNIKKLKLEYDSLYSTDDGDDGDHVYLAGNMKYLRGLEVLFVNYFLCAGPITHMQVITFPLSLKKLSLCLNHKFKWDDAMLEKIGLLPLLEELKLSTGCFERDEWEIRQGQFPSLKYLVMENAPGLKHLRMGSEEDDLSASILPRLEHLKLVDLHELMKIPFELGNIDTLKTINLISCQQRAIRSLKEMFDEQVELAGGEDQLSFHVLIQVYEWDNLLSLASSKFYVKLL